MSNLLYKNIVIDAFSELTPAIRIAPLRLSATPFYTSVHEVPEDMLDNRNVSFYTKARYAIVAALKDLHLCQEDTVSIITTSGNFYVSSCVTTAIENVCQWNREITDSTKAILVIHEFGYPHKSAYELKKKYDLPVIEDCAYAYFTDSYNIGHIGDYVIYSLPKAFNMQLGSVMFSSNCLNDQVSPEEKDYILSHWLIGHKDKETISTQRINNHDYLAKSLKPIGISPFFELEKNVIPGVFLFRWQKNIDYQNLKEYMQRNGVESSVFYKENAFFIPVHQNLTRGELDYMVNLLTYYYENIVQ